MFDFKSKCWLSGDYAPHVLEQSKEDALKKDPDALFITADHALAKGRKGHHTVDAVYAMETAAELNHVSAALAMGQMYHQGWGVHKNRKKAVYWYETAAKLGSEEAAALLKALRRKELVINLSAVGTVLAAAAAVFVIFILPKLLDKASTSNTPATVTLPDGVLVGENTELTNVTNAKDFAIALNEIMDQYDTELMISGEQKTNRLILRFEGSGIDLSAFPAAQVIVKDNSNLVMIQFATEAEAKACLEALKQMNNVEFAETDQYTTDFLNDTEAPSPQADTSVPTYHSTYTGYDYYSWGVTYLQMDQMVAWTMAQPTQAVTVAVIDTGTQYFDEYGDRLLPGVDFFEPSNPNGWTDTDGHGTHVGGTVLDCTRGLDVYVLPLRIEFGYSTSISIIALAIEYATDEKVDVLNMSLGGGCFDSIHSATERAIQAGLVVIISAGNDAIEIESNGVCPAHISDAIIVSACDINSNPADFTNYGDCVDVIAPGVEILNRGADGFYYYGGTSQAAPHIAAFAAIILAAYPGKTMQQIEKYLGDYSINPGDPLYYGVGIPQGGCFAGD